ncbi:NTP transferase domain-containing protein [Patescibacteria group bacterium]|nr:NTP transferase domain-containing protein [Patescibacteria group bacterium]
MKVQPIILAGGKGKRMGNAELPKVLSPLKDRPIISYLLDTFRDLPFLQPVLVVGFRQEMVRQAVGPEYRYIVQEEQLGTGHAVSVCRSELEGTADCYLILYGDMPLWSGQTMQKLVGQHQESGSVLSMVTVNADHETFKSFGRIIRDDQGRIRAIREQRDCSPDELEISEVNPGLYCVDDRWLWDALERITCENAQAEYYLTDLLSLAIADGEKVESIRVEDWREALGINTPEQLMEVERILAGIHS